MAHVYYAVGQNTTDHKTGSPTCTISSGVMTFSVAQTATNMGVGDRVTYNGTSVAYISGKVSTLAWNVVTKVGAAPANDATPRTVNSIAHEYTSLSAAEAGFTDANHIGTTNLVTGNFIVHLACYRDSGADTTDVTVFGFTTDSTYYLEIYTPSNTTTECNQRQDHQGLEATGYAIDAPGNDTICISVNSINWIYIRGIDMYGVRGVSGVGRVTQTYTSTAAIAGCFWINCLAHDSVYAGSYAYGFYSARGSYTNATYYINCVAYSISNHGFLTNYNYGGTVVTYNCVAADCGSTCYRIGSTNPPTWTAKNCVSIYCVSAEWLAEAGSFSGSYNASYDGSAPNTNEISLTSDTITDYFVSANDYHINPLATYAGQLQASATDLHADATFPFSYDFEGQARPNGDWDLGADQYVVTATAAKFYRYYRNRRV